MKHLDLAIWAAWWNGQFLPGYWNRYVALIAAADRFGWTWEPTRSPRLQPRPRP